MKINTDGVLLGALAEVDEPKDILDIGTGTGVIALILAQRFPLAKIDAVEIDRTAAQTAGRNFENSPCAERLNIFPSDFKGFLTENSDRKYDLIVSNPPFHLNSLQSPKAKIALAKHAGENFFEGLIEEIAMHLTKAGLCWLILPLQVADLVKELASINNLFLKKVITLYSFENSVAHREILCFSLKQYKLESSKFVIYESVGNYSAGYKQLLQPYFIAF